MSPPALILVLAALLVHLFSARTAAVDFMPLADVRPGMRGVGKTVFQGTHIDTFSVEVLDVVPGALGPGQDMILVLLSGGSLAETGIIQGMSGSPVYIDDRLVGAVSWGWNFTKIPIGFLTPIADMARLLEEDLSPNQQLNFGGYPPPLDLDRSTAERVKETIGRPDLSTPVRLEKLALPVWLSGFSPQATQALEQELAPLGLRVLAGPGSGGPVDTVPVFEPGAPLGVQLIGGDMSATVIGTITHIEGDKVIGFGHPFLASGPADMTMTAAYIYGVVPNQISSFKLGTATQVVGAVRQDRAAGIAGLLGPSPRMLPMEVVVGTRTFSFELMRHRRFTAGLALTALLGALEGAAKARGSATLSVESQIVLTGGQTLEHAQVYSGDDLLFGAARAAVLPLAALGQSPFSAVDLDTLRFVVEVRDALEKATISQLQLETNQPLIGQSLALNITLKPYRRPLENQSVKVMLPADMSPGPFTLRVGSGQAGQNWEVRRRPDTFRPRNAAQLLEVLAYQERNDELIIEVYQSEESLTIDGRELPGLPPSVRSILRQTPASGRVGPVLGRVVHRQRLRTPYVLSGEQTLELNAKRP